MYSKYRLINIDKSASQTPENILKRQVVSHSCVNNRLAIEALQTQYTVQEYMIIFICTFVNIYV